MGQGCVLAAGAHPDDIEIMMAGAFLLLGRAGWNLHYLNVGNGSCGSNSLSADEIAEVRLEEAKQAARMAGAVFHAPFTRDLEVFYEPKLLARLGALVREIKPDILLTHSPVDYMEDHQNTSRLMVTAAFSRTIPNYPTDPPRPVTTQDMAVYHTLPWGLTDQLRNEILPDFYLDIASVIEQKRSMLACHESQRSWLDASQGFENYLDTMVDAARGIGKKSGRFELAEGWRRHQHIGFGPEDYDPLREALCDFIYQP